MRCARPEPDEGLHPGYACLAAELGSQSVVSEILSGKRDINARQAKALAARFAVSPDAFL